MSNKKTTIEAENNDAGISAGGLLGVRAIPIKWEEETVVCDGEPITNYFADVFCGTYTVSPYDRKANLWMMLCGFDSNISTGRYIGSLRDCRASAKNHWSKMIMESLEPKA